PEDPDTLDSMIQLGVAYFRLEQLDRSVPLFEEVWKSRGKTLGGDHPQTLIVGANLGVNYKVAGRLKEALPLLEKAYRAAKDHPELEWVTGELIDVYEAVGENDKATSLILERVTLVRGQIPKDSP